MNALPRPLLIAMTFALLLIPCGSYPAIASPQDAPDQSTTRTSTDIQYVRANRVVRMHHVPSRHDAVDISAVLPSAVHLLIGESVSTLPNNQSILLVSALEETHNEIIAFLQALQDADEETESSDEQPVRTFQLQHVNTHNTMSQFVNMLTSVLGPTQVTVAMDVRSSSLIVRGDSQHLDLAASIIEALDVPVDRSQASTQYEQITLRICWLVSGIDELGPVPEDLQIVLEELARSGVTGLKLAAQTMIRSTTGTDFSTGFQTILHDRWQVIVSGQSRISNDQYDVHLTIEGEGPSGAVEHRPAQPERTRVLRPESVGINTRITTSADHFVVLGLTPIGDMNSVFVVQVLTHK